MSVQRAAIRCTGECICHRICSCDLGISVAAWRCFKHEGGHCEDCDAVA